jgi:hypothetical protein
MPFQRALHNILLTCWLLTIGVSSAESRFVKPFENYLRSGDGETLGKELRDASEISPFLIEEDVAPRLCT